MTKDTSRPRACHQKISGLRSSDRPRENASPLADCADFDIRIARDGTWFYKGSSISRRDSSISRRELVKLFASVLRRSDSGEFLLVTNAELRFPFPFLSKYRFSLAAFVDGGNAWEDITNVSWKSFRPTAPRDEVDQQDYWYSAGMGVRYNTPVGPIRLDVGFPIKKDELTENYRFHLSLGQIF